MFSRVGNATLDLSTLDGTAHFMDTVWDNGVITHEYYSFDITYIDCSWDQSSSGVDKREELIGFLRMYSTTPEE
jgi:hypothetical protein